MLTLSAMVACAQGEACDPQIVEEDPGREPESHLPEPQPQLPQAVGAAFGGEAVAGGSRRPARAGGEPARLGQEVRRPVRSQPRVWLSALPCVWLSALLDRVRLIHACVLQADGRFPCAGRCLGAAEAVRGKRRLCFRTAEPEGCVLAAGCARSRWWTATPLAPTARPHQQRRPRMLQARGAGGAPPGPAADVAAASVSAAGGRLPYGRSQRPR
eukprot:COSAG04_NODE_2_length_56781_cov_25.092252_20_plen_214_part_00